MLDTNTCIYILNQKPLEVIARFKHTEISQIGLSSITLSELQYGVSKSSRPDQNQMALAQFVAPLVILPFKDEAAQYYGDLRVNLERQGTPIGSLDMLIAAHTLSVACTLVTRNENEFGRIPDLTIENWAK